MNYFTAMSAVLRLDGPVYQRMYEEQRGVRYATINISVLGIAHALFSLYFSRELLAEAGSSLDFSLVTLWFVIFSGMSVAFLMHGGAALFIWTFSRGVGGHTAFLPIYFNLGIAFITLWPMTPALAAIQAGYQHLLLYAYAIAAGGYASVAIFKAVKLASGLSLARMSFAAALTIVYVGCFLYLWL